MPGAGEQVGACGFREADTIDQAVAAFKNIVPRAANDPQGAQAVEAAQRLYQLGVCAAHRGAWRGERYFISPDGNLNLVPFEVLVGPDGKFLIEEYTFNYLAAGRDIVGFGELTTEGNTPLLMGDPDFDCIPGSGIEFPASVDAGAESLKRVHAKRHPMRLFIRALQRP